MAAELASNSWGIISHHQQEGILELRWLPTTAEMTDDDSRPPWSCSPSRPSRRGARDLIVYGDLIGMGLALATLYALRYRWRLAIPLAWVFVVATVLDLSNAAVMGIREDLFDKAADVSWQILTFYVPALWVSVILVAWRLWTREVGSQKVE
jgi:hypothetical protein